MFQDNWESISDAQQAAASRALFDLLKGLPKDQEQHLEQLGAPWRDLWYGWQQQQEQQLGVGWEEEQLAAQQQEKEAFVK